jgi:hypothetical protein
VETQNGCWKHHYGEYSENRFFQMVKKNLQYGLPQSFPHEEPGWKMVFSELGNLHELVTICMSLFDNQPAFCRITEMTQNGEPLMVGRIATVPNNVIQLTEDDDLSGDEVTAAEIVSRKPQAFPSLAALEERDDAAFNNPFSYSAYNELHSKLKQERQMELKGLQKQKQAEVATMSAAAKGKLPPAKGLKEMRAERKRGKK